MGDNRAENTGEVTSREGDTGLSGLGVVGSAAGQTLVHHLDDRLKRGELHHGVGNLSSPQRVDALVEAGRALLGDNLSDAIKGALVRAGDGTLGAHLDGLKRAERNVGEEFSRRRGGQVQTRLVLGGRIGTGNIGVRLFEVFIPTVLEGTLRRVTNQRGAPTGEDAAYALGAVDFAPGLDIALVQLRVDLTASFDEIERGDGGVRETLLGHLVSGGHIRYVYGSGPLGISLTQARRPPNVQVA